MKSGIYCIRDLRNNKLYVGKDTRIPKRWSSHKVYLRKNTHFNKYLQRAWNKYGEENFEYSVLEFCDADMLEEREIHYIGQLNSKIPNGYNITSGGDGGLLGVERDIETKLKISKSLSGRKHSDERIKNIRKGIKIRKKGRDHHNFGKKMKGSSSRYIGVFRHKDAWESYIRLEGKLVYIKHSKDEEICAKAYDEFVIKNGLDYPLNFPKDRKRLI